MILACMTRQSVPRPDSGLSRIVRVHERSPPARRCAQTENLDERRKMRESDARGDA